MTFMNKVSERGWIKGCNSGGRNTFLKGRNNNGKIPTTIRTG